MAKHTQTNRQQIADKLHEYVWLFCGVGALRIKKSLKSQTYIHLEIAFQISSLMREHFITVQSYPGEIFNLLSKLAFWGETRYSETFTMELHDIVWVNLYKLFFFRDLLVSNSKSLFQKWVPLFVEELIIRSTRYFSRFASLVFTLFAERIN